MRFRKVICLGGLIALTGCCHTVPTNEFVDPRFNLTLLPYSKIAWTATLRPTEIKESNDKGTVIKKPCVLLENKMGFVRFQCREFENPLCYHEGCTPDLEQVTYEITDYSHTDAAHYYPNLMVRQVIYERNNQGEWKDVIRMSYYISKESMDLLRDKEAACALEK